MPKSLIIVESPTKARTIQRILGPDTQIMASMGHVRDLPRRKLGVDLENNFEPQYSTANGKKVLPKLRKAAKGVDVVYLAPDPDREGEAIAWHIKEALKLSDEKARRVTFHEITPGAIRKAFSQAGSLDMDKVKAQQARRILDRLVGYKISPLLWKNVAKGLSAGRVQSVALRLIVEREKEIAAFSPDEFWRIEARFAEPGAFEALFDHRKYPDSPNCPHCSGKLTKPQSDRQRVLECEKCARKYQRDKASGTLRERAAIPNEEAANALISEITKTPFEVTEFSTSESRAKLLPPFNTSLLQQSASICFGFSASRTMRIAQTLYEGIEIAGETVGLITYMRTDSFRCAPEAAKEARKFIRETLGDKYLPEKPPQFRKRKAAQEAHEAIRPTSVLRRPEDVKPYLDGNQHRLYELIWNRFLASQTARARYRDTKAELTAGNCVFYARGRRTIFDGATHFWPSKSNAQIVPDLETGQILNAGELVPTQHFTQPPSRYTEASLVRTLEREGIGRPSTYASIISTLYRRGYAVKRRRRFHATELGCLVAEKLVAHFPGIMDVGFTAKMEAGLDEIEEARHDWKQVLEDFWSRLHTSLERAQEEMESVKNKECPGESCPECGGTMVIRYSRRGTFLGCKTFPKCKGTKPVPREGEEEAPRPKSVPLEEQCPNCGKNLVLRHSRRGPFVGCSGYPDCRFTKSVDQEDQPASKEEIEEAEAEAEEV